MRDHWKLRLQIGADFRHEQIRVRNDSSVIDVGIKKNSEYSVGVGKVESFCSEFNFALH